MAHRTQTFSSTFWEGETRARLKIAIELIESINLFFTWTTVNDLVSEYQQYQEATADEDAEFDEEQEAEVDEN